MLHIITGPPCSGKSTYVREHKAPGDVVIDNDLIAQAIGSDREHMHDYTIGQTANAMVRAAIEHLLEYRPEAWVIHTRLSDELKGRYIEAGAEVIEMDTDLETCLERAQERLEGTEAAIREYFDTKEGQMEHKQRDMYIKEVGEGEDHYIIAYAATFHEEPDSYGDIIAPGAFTETLEKWNASSANIPLLFGHRMDDPLLNIGTVTEATEDATGLLVKAVFDMTNERGAYAYKLVKEGRLSKLSFAYDVLDAAPRDLDGMTVNELRKLDIFEVSLVPVPANQHAEVLVVKDMEPETKEATDVPEEPTEANSTEEEPTEAKANIEALIARIDIETLED